MTFRIGRGARPTRDYAHKVSVPAPHLNNVIRMNISENTYEIISNGKTIRLDMSGDPAHIINTLTQLRIPISYLQAVEAVPMKWLDYTKSTPPDLRLFIEGSRDNIELIPRYGQTIQRREPRAPFLPNVYYRLRNEIELPLFQQIIRGTNNVNVYTFGKSTFYERRSQHGDIIILEDYKGLTGSKYYIYPISAEIRELIEPISTPAANFADVIKWLERSYGGSKWLNDMISTGDWERVERAILSHNVFIPLDKLNLIIEEFKRRNKFQYVSISSRFAREYKGLAEGEYSSRT